MYMKINNYYEVTMAKFNESVVKIRSEYMYILTLVP